MDVIAIVIQVGVVVTPLLVFVYLMKLAKEMFENTYYADKDDRGLVRKVFPYVRVVSVLLFLFSFAYVIDIVLKFRASV